MLMGSGSSQSGGSSGARIGSSASAGLRGNGPA